MLGRCNEKQSAGNQGQHVEYDETLGDRTVAFGNERYNAEGCQNRAKHERRTRYQRMSQAAETLTPDLYEESIQPFINAVQQTDSRLHHHHK